MKTGLFDRAFNVWWQDLNLAYQTDDKDYVNELERIFPRLKSHFALYPPKNKDRRRLRIHALGRFVLKLYFSLRKNKASSANAAIRSISVSVTSRLFSQAESGRNSQLLWKLSPPVK